MSRKLDNAQTADQLINQLRAVERAQHVGTHQVADIRLREDGLLYAAGEQFPVDDAARADLARLARIPVPFFGELDHDLRAILFNRRLADSVPADAMVDIVSNDSGVLHVRPSSRLRAVPRSDVVTAIVEQAPRDTVSNDIRVITYALNGHVDVALVTRALSAEPVRGDIVCGGAHLTIEESGATQIGPALFRLFCSNGAMSRICWKGHHRIRRGDGKDSRSRHLAMIGKFARESWNSWHDVVSRLRPLASRDLGDLDSLIARLRGRPFLISEAAARLVREELETHRERGRTPSHYDLWNAITSVGSHSNILPQYAYRLRLGAGALARGRIGVCAQCRQFILSD
jgi:hypothetical protein